MSYRPEFTAALDLLARASAIVATKQRPFPILVGGSAVELFSVGDITSGDFDLVMPFQEEIEEALSEVGFCRSSGAGSPIRGLVHQDLRIGVEVVASSLMDGRADYGKIRIFELDTGGSIRVIAPEDLIADRMAQCLAVNPPVSEMREQAVMLYQLVTDMDNEYLNSRIECETAGDANLSILEQWVESDVDGQD